MTFCCKNAFIGIFSPKLDSLTNRHHGTLYWQEIYFQIEAFYILIILPHIYIFCTEINHVSPCK